MAASDPRLERVGFCKLKGEGIEHYAKKYEITIGRKSKSTALDVAIGDNMNISRQHASIVYNFEKRAWELRVHGKNGVTVRDTLYTPSSPPVVLQSGDLLSLGDRSFFFLLEKGSRARQKAAKRPRPASAPKQPPASKPRTSPSGAPQPQQTAPPQAGAYAQPDAAQQLARLQQAVAVQAAQASAGLAQHYQAHGQPGAAHPMQPGMLNPTVMGLQAMLQQRQQQQQQLAGTAGLPVSPLLQQLMAANANTARPAGMASLPQDVAQQVGFPTNAGAAALEQPPRFQYPEGFPATLLQGLQNHQQLQQQIRAQAAPAQALTQEQAARLASSDEQSSAAAHPPGP